MQSRFHLPFFTKMAALLAYKPALTPVKGSWQRETLLVLVLSTGRRMQEPVQTYENIPCHRSMIGPTGRIKTT